VNNLFLSNNRERSTKPTYPMGSHTLLRASKPEETENSMGILQALVDAVKLIVAPATAALALSTVIAIANLRANDAHAADPIPGTLDNLPSPEGLSGLEGMDAARQISTGDAAFPVTVNLQSNMQHLRARIRSSLEVGLRSEGVDNVWIHISINEGDSTTVTFWTDTVPHEYNVADVNADAINTEAKFHKAHLLKLSQQGK